MRAAVRRPLGPMAAFTRIFVLSHDLLLVTLEPAGDHGDQDMKNHSHSSGWRQCRYCTVQYTPNLSNFNGVETADLFNHTRWAFCAPPTHIAPTHVADSDYLSAYGPAAACLHSRGYRPTPHFHQAKLLD